jgi:hypothetical protein
MYGSSCLPHGGHQLSWFVTIILYGGGHEIKKMMVTQELQEFLDRFRPPRG